MDHNLFFGGERVQFAAESVKVAAYDFGTFALGSLEQGMFGEMGDPAVEISLVPCSAFDCQ